MAKNESPQIINASTLPQQVRGRKSTEPRVSVTGSGRIVLNTYLSRAWDKVTKVLVRYKEEETAFRIYMQGFEPDTVLPKGVLPENLFAVMKDKATKAVSFAAAGFLETYCAPYKYAEAGNQQYDAVFNEAFGYCFDLPKVTPKRIVQQRVQRVTAGGVAPVTAAA